MPAPTRNLLIAPAAEIDLAEIGAYIAGDSPDAATKFLTALEAKFQPLRQRPLMGSTRDHLATGLRAIPYKRYVIYYLYTGTTITIVRVVHSARDVGTMF